jgi:hypothetical protein
VLDRVQHHGAIVAAHFSSGHELPTGTETLLDVSQVYVRLPIEPASCAPRPRVICREGLVDTYTRTPDRCLVFDACADHADCPLVRPPACLDGYTLHRWPTDDLRCTGFACDPAFIDR